MQSSGMPNHVSLSLEKATGQFANLKCHFPHGCCDPPPETAAEYCPAVHDPCARAAPLDLPIGVA